MKKLLIGLSVLFLISGCDNGNEKLTCTSANNANGMTSDTKYEIEYNDKDVKLVTITYDYNDDNFLMIRNVFFKIKLDFM